MKKRLLSVLLLLALAFTLLPTTALAGNDLTGFFLGSADLLLGNLAAVFHTHIESDDCCDSSNDQHSDNSQYECKYADDTDLLLYSIDVCAAGPPTAKKK